MSQPLSMAPYEAPPASISPPPRRVRPPAVEAIAGWSARHRKTAVFGWLALVATVVRGVLLPAAMTLLGDRCWYLPRWLSWLPGRTGAAPSRRERPQGALAASPGPGGNWATRGAVAAGRGIALVGLTLVGVVLWVAFATAVTLAPLGVGLPTIPVTVRAIRRLEIRVRRLVRCRHR